MTGTSALAAGGPFRCVRAVTTGTGDRSHDFPQELPSIAGHARPRRESYLFLDRHNAHCRSPLPRLRLPARTDCDAWTVCMGYLEPSSTGSPPATFAAIKPSRLRPPSRLPLAALALLAHNRGAAARPLVDRLLEMQNDDGSLGIDRLHDQPGWPTGLGDSGLASRTVKLAFDPRYVPAYRTRPRMDASASRALWRHGRIGTATTSTCTAGPGSSARTPGSNRLPSTCWRLKHTGLTHHHRARDAVALLDNRLLDRAAATMATRSCSARRCARTWSRPALRCWPWPARRTPRAASSARSNTCSANFRNDRHGFAELRTVGPGRSRRVSRAEPSAGWRAAADRTLARDASSYKLGLIALAALGRECPLVSAQWSQPATALPPAA